MLPPSGAGVVASSRILEGKKVVGGGTSTICGPLFYKKRLSSDEAVTNGSQGGRAAARRTGRERPQWVGLRAFNARHSWALGVSQNPSIFGLKSLLQIS
jgi:hypothetical protein